MRNISELNLGYSDAQNYSKKANKQMLNDVFVKNDFLDDLIKPDSYFLIGEKGTGKTAYATFLNNNNYNENKSILTYLSATDYEKFYKLKKMKNLQLADYDTIWKVIILLILSKSITDKEKIVNSFSRGTLNLLMNAIDEYYMNAFNPEIVTALRIVDNSEIAADIISKHLNIGGKKGASTEKSEIIQQESLYYIEREFSKAIEKLKLSKNIILFIDGIDIRPNDIPYEDYIQCIQGLANACWELNTHLFQNVKDSKGYIKVVLLLRPDIFNALNLQNSMNKLLDNSVLLDWKTTYTEYPNSYLFKISQKLLSFDQDEKNATNIWDKYFDWELPSTNSYYREFDTAFMEFLKISLSRPRDILVILKMLQDKMKKDGFGSETKFSQKAYESDEFQNNYSNYFMGSLKDHLSFYYSQEDFKQFLKFFEYFKSSGFTYDEYIKKYAKFRKDICGNAKGIPEFIDTPNDFLQLLYNSNIIAVIEDDLGGGRYFHFSYREKTASNICPEVMIAENVTYVFHYGLYKKVNFGRY